MDSTGTSEVVRDCTHVHAHHEHGSVLAYDQDRCRCRPCRSAASAARAAHRRQTAPSRLVDAAPVVARARALVDEMGLAELARVTGLKKSTITGLFHPRRRRWSVHVRTAEAILAVDPSRASSRPAAPTVWRLRALTRIGWSSSQLAAELSMPQTTVRRLVTLGADFVDAGVEEKAEGLYSRLSRTPRPADRESARFVARLVNRAQRLGWPSPEQLDAEWESWSVKSSRPEQVDARPSMWRLRALVCVGWPVRLLAEELGYPHRTVDALLKGELDWVSPEFAAQVDVLYARGWERPPDDPVSGAARARGRRLGWPMPMDIDDRRLAVDPGYVPTRSAQT